MAVDADFTVLDDLGDPVEGMVLQIYNLEGSRLISSGQTDALGELTLSLDEDTRYQVRFYGKHILARADTTYIRVVTPPPANVWQFEATTFTPPVSPNPNMCRLWGFFVNPAGQRLRGTLLRIIPRQDPAVIYDLHAHASGQNAIPLATDNDGFVQLDLPRGGNFSVVMGGYTDTIADFEVPDANSWNLVDVLFPTPVSLTFAPAGPTALGVDDTEDYVPSLTLSDGRVLTLETEELATEWVEFTSSDEDVMTVATVEGVVRVTAVAAGPAQLSATVLDTVAMPRVPAAVMAVTAVSVVVA